MKKVLLICLLLVVGMMTLVSWNYYKYNKSQDCDKKFNLNSIINQSYNFSEPSNDNITPDWCNDVEYVDSVFIPIQENIYNINITPDYAEMMPKHLVCIDSQAFGVQETLYNKSVYAKELKTKMIEINTKLDSLEKNY